MCKTNQGVGNKEGLTLPGHTSIIMLDSISFDNTITLQLQLQTCQNMEIEEAIWTNKIHRYYYLHKTKLIVFLYV
jgi:hypothetical protein